MSQRINGIYVGRRANRRIREMLPIDAGGKRSPMFHGDDEIAHEARMEANCQRVQTEMDRITVAGQRAVAALQGERLYEQMPKVKKRQERIRVRQEAEFAAQTDLAPLDEFKGRD